MSRFLIWLKAIRVEQWTKNGVVMMAWFFSIADTTQTTLQRGWTSFLLAVGMAGSFSLISSAFYLLNDVADYDADRLHPQKKLRPVAAGLIDRMAAVRAGLVLFASGFAFPALIVIFLPSRSIAFATVLAYTVMQCLYTGLFKRVPYIDVMILAAGFVLRAIAGAAIIDAYISPWLLVCTFTLSMFLAFCKRRHEKDVARDCRIVLKSYHPRLLAAAIIISAAATVAEYVAYTLTSAMGKRLPYLFFSSVFVFFGIVRYILLAWKKEDVGRPERILLNDRIMILTIVGYAISVAIVMMVG
jgi:4-hydroxybenzoate polyprenyltransferase